MSGIYWLASYPKSGNTWLRVFLANYLQDHQHQPAKINELNGSGAGFVRESFNEILGFDSTNLTWKQIDHYRPLVYEEMAAKFDGTPFLKIHDAYSFCSNGEPVFSERVTAGVIYLIRNPLDVAVSFAHHLNKSIDKAIESMAMSDTALVHNKDSIQLPQRMLSWSEHVCSWTDEPGLNILTMRYEDMLNEPVESFAKIVEFSGLETDPKRVAIATELSSFKKLKEQEQKYGFKEKQPTAKSFFRKGLAGSWRGVMTDRQIEQIINQHGDVMRRFRYLTADNEIIT